MYGNRVVILYKAIKTTFSFESHLETIVSRHFSTAITKLRIHAHNLRKQGSIGWIGKKHSILPSM